MQDLLTSLLLGAAFGGLSVIGVLVLVSGLFSAQRTSSVITYAALATILFTAQLGSISTWHSFGVGIGGESGKGGAIIQWGSVAAIALVGGFLAVKLPPALGKTVGAARWPQDGAMISAAIVVVYVLYLLSGVLLQWAGLPTSPATWLTAVAGPVLAWGLWRHRRWAWYAALAGAACAASAIIWSAYPELVGAPFMFLATPPGVSLTLLVLLLGMLLFSNARKLCSVRRA
jgi:hypothetical protein